MTDADLQAAMLTADLNNDRDAEAAYQQATAEAVRTGFTGEVQGPVMWTTSGDRIAPVDVYENGVAVDHLIHWLPAES